MSEALSGTYRRKAGDPVLCRQFFSANALSFPMVDKDEIDGSYYVIDSTIHSRVVEDGDWIVPEEGTAHFAVVTNEDFHAQYEVLDDFRVTTTHSGDPSNPPDGIADDPDDTQAKLGQKAQ